MAGARELKLEILGSRFVVELPDDEWTAFIEYLWRPFVHDEPADGAHRLRIRVDPMWTWAIEADDAVMGMGDDRWFLAAELRYWIVARAVENASGQVLLHASLVEREGRGAVLVGRSGGGKTTLSLHLASRGWGYRGDDLVLVDPRSAKVSGVPTPAGIRDVGRWAELGSAWNGVAVPAPQGAFMLPATPLLSGPHDPIEVGAIAFLSFEPGVPAVAEPLSAANAAVLCMSQSHLRDVSAVDVYARMCKGAATARLRYGSSADAEAALEGLLADPG